LDRLETAVQELRAHLDVLNPHVRASRAALRAV
jgi:outer membrane murein-binding lipoprotein Lpp